MSEKQFHPNPILNKMFEDTAQRLESESPLSPAPKPLKVETGPDGYPRIMAGLSDACSAPEPEPPPYCIPVARTRSQETIEIEPCILVEQMFESRRARIETMKREIREDLNVSKQVVQSLVELIRNPPNMKEKYISYDAMPAALQRVVKAYTDAAEANRELDEAIKALAAEPRSSS
jgi:hypothetical protein